MDLAHFGKISMAFFLALIIFLPLVSAEQTVKTLEIPIGYVASTYANTDYIIPINIDSSRSALDILNPESFTKGDYLSSSMIPEGIDEIISAELIIEGDFPETSAISGMIRKDGRLYPCNPLSWVSPSFPTYGYDTTFDCSDLIRKFEFYGGKIEFGVRTDKNIKNMRAILRISYYNRPETIAHVFGTEYIPSENGTVFLQLFDSNENTVDDAYCEITIYYPDKTKWHDSSYMDFLEDGLYYKDIFLPDNKLGVFMTSAFCSYEENVYEYKLPSEDVLYGGSLMTLNYLSTDDAENVEDTDCVFVATDGGTYQEFRYNYTTIGNLNLTLIDELSLFWVGSNERNGAYLQAWNFDTSSWDTIGATFTKSDTTPFECERSHAVSRSITSDIQDYVYQDEVRFRMITGSNGEIYTDEATIIFHGTGTFIDSVRGGGEIHVSSLTNQTFNCSMGDTNITASVNSSEISESVWSFYNRSLTENITATVDLELCDVWNCSDRELTDFDFEIDCGDINASVEVSGSYTDLCYNTCTEEQEQRSYPDCSCYCESKCDSGEVQDKYCTCHPAQLIGETIMEEVGFHDTLSYEAKLINSNTTASISGAKCDLVITDSGGSILIYEEDVFESQDNGYIKGNFRISDTFQVDNDYTFKIICGSSLASQNFTVKPTIQPNSLLNLQFFIRDNFIPISVIVILLIFILFLIFGRKHR